jgi:hypothetical protein
MLNMHNKTEKMLGDLARQKGISIAGLANSVLILALTDE